MSPASVARRLLPAVCCCLLLLAGCAGKQPKTLPLAPAENQAAAALWAEFLGTPRPAALDADIRLGWDALGSKGAVSATLLLQRQPVRVRFAANDPLGRALVLAVADATSFTLVDNRIGHVYQGAIRSKFWQSYVPASVAPEDVLPLLGGFLPEADGQAVATRDEVSQGFWYQWRDGQALHHHVLLDRRHKTMQRHLLFDGQGELLLALDYADYREDSTSGFSWPAHLRITGEAVTGTLTLQVEQIYSHTPQGAAAFQLAPPPHFTVEQMP